MAHIVGGSIVLREYREADKAEIRAWVNSPESTRNLSNIFIRGHTVPMSDGFVDRILRNEDANSFHYVIARRDDESYLGQIDLAAIDWYARCGTLAIIVPDPANRGRGYGAEAIRLLLDYAFARINLNKVELEVHEFNEDAYRLYLRLGFVEEGRRRARLYRDGRYYDSIQMGILRDEFYALFGEDYSAGSTK
jgi:RimJ/RimL family protein N-acetyltransferase